MNLVDDHSGYAGDLLPLLRGELARTQHIALIEHLNSCQGCRRALVDTADSHASLTAMRRTLTGQAEPVHLQPMPALTELPRRAHGFHPWQALVAAAAALLTSFGLYTGLHQHTGPAAAPPSSAPSGRLLLLHGSGTGQVTMTTPTRVTTAVTIRTALHPPGPGRFYFAWLLEPVTNKMLRLGVIGPNGTATFSLDTTIINRYHGVDISLQADNGDPAHATTSELRTTY